MPAITHQGKVYRLTIGSDVVTEPDGMYLELDDPDSDENPILFAYRSDESRAITVSMYRQNVPLELVQAFLEAIRSELIEK